MTKHIFLFILLNVLLFSACSKEELYIDYTELEPVFKVEAVRGMGDTLRINAGVDDFYLLTLSNYMSGDTIYHPYSIFKKVETCAENCNESFAMELYDVAVDAVDTLFAEYGFPQEAFSLNASNGESARVILKYTDPNGTVFSSDQGQQPQTQYFKVSHIELFGTNEEGHSVKLLKINFSCNLYDEFGNVMSLENGILHIGVAMID
ncbi:MAG TPA: hypothetical protein ENJ45_00050 [Phaeodactylibacter sp.]|nr:hypothetical protein [Phaeodactylibacter sp.]